MMRFMGAVKVDDVAGGDGLTGVDFSDEEKAVAWLEKQSLSSRYALTARAALRACPSLIMFEEPRFSSLALPIFRIILLYALRGSNLVTSPYWLDVEISAAQSAAESVTDTTQLGASNYSDYFSGAITFPIIRGFAYAIAKSMDNAADFSAILKDSEYDSYKIYSARLWHDIEDTRNFESNHKLFLQHLEADRNIWGFWHDWYLAMWEGRWTDWELAVEVAKIPNDVWENGAEAIADAIRGIEARRALEAEVAALKEQFKQTKIVEQPHNRLHNNPPEAIESQQHLKSEITLIWELLEDTETELAKPAPSPSTLRVIADTLWEISLRIGKYCASLADVALNKSAEVIGETGTKAGIAVLVTNTAAQNEGVKAVAHAIWEFVKTLPAG